MFDHVPADIRDEPLILARCLFFDHGHRLAEAAAMLGGASAEARVISCALQLQDASKVTPPIRRDLVTLHQLFSLDRVGDPACVETAFFSAMNPASREVEVICLLTDMLADVLAALKTSARIPAATGPVGGFAAS